MKSRLTRRTFTTTAAGLVLATPALCHAQESGTQDPQEEEVRGPVEAEFTRDYDAPGFKPSWRNKQINRLMAQDFVIYAHSDLEKVRMLYDREPGLLNATLDWGGGDWETALGGASHMGRKDIATFLLSKGARLDIFCAAMMGMLASADPQAALDRLPSHHHRVYQAHP